MTFEEWYAETKKSSPYTEKMNCQLAWEAGYAQATFEANSKLGDEGNEAEKVARCTEAVTKVKMLFDIPDHISDGGELRAIIKEAQG